MLALLARAEGRPRDPAGRARHGRGVPHRRPHHGDGERRGASRRGTPDAVRANARRAGRPISARRIDDGRHDAATTRIERPTDLHAYYGASHVLHGVDLADRAAARPSACSGRNGMGKTHADPHAARPRRRSAQGRIGLSRPATCSRARAARRSRGWASPTCPKGRGVFPNLSVRENLRDGGAAGHRRPQRLDLRARARRPFRASPSACDHGGQQLSGGEQQMLSIGRALMTNPDLLILDEATEGLAPLIVARDLARHRRDPRRPASRR